ncbi:unnamed protein product [Durusdinium trenchii]|uniref:Uncharacterized protein n=1 Tax=Durusdinium trenchii TaxID=1381693 RepID=A0ABP0IPF0_9DINO
MLQKLEQPCSITISSSPMKQPGWPESGAFLCFLTLINHVPGFKVHEATNLLGEAVVDRSGAVVSKADSFYPSAFPKAGIAVLQESTQNFTRTYVGGYDYATREAAKGKCQSLGYQGLCSKAEVEGYAICAFGWMSDYKGFWFHQTLQGCGSGIGFRDGSSWNPVGAYCCHQAAAIEREYVGGYDYATREAATGKCQSVGYQGLCSKAEVEGWSKCAHGWMSDYKGYWFHETKSGCGSGTGWRSGSSQNAVGAYCCHLSQIERKYVPCRRLQVRSCCAGRPVEVLWKTGCA